MKIFKDSSNDHIYMLDYTNQYGGEQPDDEASKGLKR